MSQTPYGRPYPEEPGQPQGRTYGPSYGHSHGPPHEPSYGPSYGEQPGYGQPDQTAVLPVYGAPDGGPGSLAGGYPLPTPPKKSRALPIVLITLAVILLFCAGSGVFTYLNWDKVQKLANAAASSSPRAPTSPAGEPSSAATTETTTTYKVVEPKTLNGRPKLTGKQFESLTDRMRESVDGLPGATSSVGALYGSVERRNIVAVVAVAAQIDDPEGVIEDTFGVAGLHGTKVTGITEVDTGQLGGRARCGKVVEDNLSMAVCVWADDGTLGTVRFFFKSVSSAKAEFPKIRGLIEKKSN